MQRRRWGPCCCARPCLVQPHVLGPCSPWQSYLRERTEAGGSAPPVEVGLSVEHSATPRLGWQRCSAGRGCWHQHGSVPQGRGWGYPRQSRITPQLPDSAGSALREMWNAATGSGGGWASGCEVRAAHEAREGGGFWVSPARCRVRWHWLTAPVPSTPKSPQDCQSGEGRSLDRVSRKQSPLLGCSPCLVLLCSMIAMTETLPPASFGHSHHKWHPSCALAPSLWHRDVVPRHIVPQHLSNHCALRTTGEH